MKPVSGFDPAWIVLGMLIAIYIWYWILQLFRFVSKRYYIRTWDGSNDSAQFRRGGLWWGWNDRTHEWFFIYNGVVCWQVQSYRPTFAIWGVCWPWEALRHEKVLKNYQKGDIYRLSEPELGKLPKNHPYRKELEEDLRESVEQQIERARNGNVSSIALLVSSLKSKSYDRQRGFYSWVVRRGILLGVRESHRIGKAICKEQEFTLNEAIALYQSVAAAQASE